MDVIRFDDKVAVLANSNWTAKKGKDALKIVWTSEGKLESTSDMEANFKKIVTKKPAEPKREDGDVDLAMKRAATTLQAEYEAPFLPHNTMEPMNFFADVQPERVTLIGPTQTPASARKAVSELLNIPEEKISVTMTRMGGGFGRRLRTDYALEAAKISQLAKAPVNVLWTREDDMSGGIYRPMGLYRYTAALDKNNNLIGWHHRSTAVSTNNGTRQDNFPAGAVPNLRVDYNKYESPVTTGAWRAPNHNFVAFSEDGFLDEIAHKIGKDPIEFHLELLRQARKNPVGKLVYDPDKYIGVIEKVADMAGWGKPSRDDIYQGFGSHFSFGTHVAQIAEISVKNGQLKVHKVYCAVDCGIVVNRSGAETEVEGGIMDGLGHAMYGQLTLTNGKPDQNNFDKYRVMRIKEAPEIQVEFIESNDSPQGLGEPGLPPVAAAVGNAIFAATGKRIRKLPFMLTDLS